MKCVDLIKFQHATESFAFPVQQLVQNPYRRAKSLTLKPEGRVKVAEFIGLRLKIENKEL